MLTPFGMVTFAEPAGTPPHQFWASDQELVIPLQVFAGAYTRVTFDVKLAVGQVPLFNPVICKVWPLFAAVSVTVVKLAVPDALAVTLLMGVCATPLIE